MESIFDVLSTLNSFGWVVGSLIAWVALKPEQRTELKKILMAVWAHSTKALPVLLALSASAVNIWRIYEFGTATTPPTRGDILELLMHCWNAGSYFFFGMVLFAFWMKDIFTKEYPIASQT